MIFNEFLPHKFPAIRLNLLWHWGISSLSILWSGFFFSISHAHIRTRNVSLFRNSFRSPEELDLKFCNNKHWVEETEKEPSKFSTHESTPSSIWNPRNASMLLRFFCFGPENQLIWCSTEWAFLWGSKTLVKPNNSALFHWSDWM